MYALDEELRYQDGSLATNVPVRVVLRGTSTAQPVYVGHNASFGITSSSYGESAPENTLHSDSQGRVRGYVAPPALGALDLVILTEGGGEAARMPLEPFTAELQNSTKTGTGLLIYGTSWLPYTLVAGFHTPRAYQTSEGLVLLEGMMRPSSLTPGATILTLPSFLRPKAAKYFPVVQYTGAAYGTAGVTVNADGTVVLAGSAFTSTTIGWLSLSGIKFETEA